MDTIQALNSKASGHHKGFRISVWAGSESTPGIRWERVIYAPNLRSAVSAALKEFRRVIPTRSRLTDFTINSEPLRADETILPAASGVARPRRQSGGFQKKPVVSSVGDTEQGVAEGKHDPRD